MYTKRIARTLTLTYISLLICAISIFPPVPVGCFVVVDEEDDEDYHFENYHDLRLNGKTIYYVPVDETTQESRRELQTNAQISDFRLINADTDVVITSLVDGMSIDLTTSPTSNFNIQATVTAGTIGSVRFGYNTTTNFRTESEAPYAFCGNAGADYASCGVLVLGSHRITATPYTGIRATGTMGATKAVSFRIIRSSPTLAPTLSPVLPPLFPMSAPTGIPASKAPTANAPQLVMTEAPASTAPTTKAPTTKAPTTKAPQLATTTKAPASKSPTKAPVSVSCTIPKKHWSKSSLPRSYKFLRYTFKFTSNWETMVRYPLNIAEAQGDIIGTDIVITGGFSGGFRSTTNRTYTRSVLDNVLSAWRRMDDIPSQIGITHAATVVVGSKMYLCGGYLGPDPGPHLSNCFVYDHSKPPGLGLQWSTFIPLPNNGTAGGAMLYHAESNTIYYTGGGQRPIPNNIFTVDLNNTWKISLDHVDLGWISSTPIPYLGNHQSFVTVNFLQQEELHYVFGGQKGDNERNGNQKEMFELDTRTGSTATWIQRADMPYPRGHSAISTRPIGPCGFLTAGGATNGGNNFNRTADIHYYHIPTNTWNWIGTIPYAIASSHVFVGPDEYVYFVARNQTNRRKFSFE